MLKILSLIIFFYFINIASCFANEEIYNIKNNEVYLENNGNVLEVRENAKNISFKNGFNILAKNILTPEDFLRFTQISDFNPTELVSDYKIESEKITEINYYAEISINFNPERVRKFFSENSINLNIFVSESYLIFPVFKKFNTLYLWDKENFWYDFLLEEYDQQSLLKLYFPKKSNINRVNKVSVATKLVCHIAIGYTPHKFIAINPTFLSHKLIPIRYINTQITKSKIICITLIDNKCDSNNNMFIAINNGYSGG